MTIEGISSLVKEIDIKNTMFACSDVKNAYQIALEKDIDLFILDTSRSGDASGLKFVDSIRKIEKYAFIPIIFVTSLEDARLYPYEKMHCYSFIEKSFDSAKLKELVKQCLSFPMVEQKRKTLYFRKDGIILVADREDVVYVECINHVLNIHTIQGDLLCIHYVTLKKFLADVDSIDFIQCSRNSVVNKGYMHNVDITNRIIRLRGQIITVEIGIMYKKELREIFK